MHEATLFHADLCIRLKTFTIDHLSKYVKQGHTIVTAADFIRDNSVTEEISTSETNLEKAKMLYINKGVKCLQDQTLNGIHDSFMLNEIGQVWYVFNDERCLIFDGINWAEIIEEPTISKTEIVQPEYENGEEVECLVDNEWCEFTYVGKANQWHAVFNGSLKRCTDEKIRKIQPVRHPEIGALCLFSDSENQYKNNEGIIFKLDKIEGGRFYIGLVSYVFCREIETIKFKD